jgi:hypothetical protein
MSGWELGYAVALMGGVISFLSPCVLPLVPGYLSFIAGQATGADDRADNRHISARQRLLTPVTFVFGFSLVFVFMGAGATWVGQSLLQYRYEANPVGGAIVTIFGLFIAGVIRPRWLLRDYRAVNWSSRSGTPGAAGVLDLAGRQAEPRGRPALRQLPRSDGLDDTCAVQLAMAQSDGLLRHDATPPQNRKGTSQLWTKGTLRLWRYMALHRELRIGISSGSLRSLCAPCASSCRSCCSSLAFM